MLNERRILLGATGGIAIYKSVELAGRLIKAGAGVKTILTENATRFIAPLTFASITRDRVATDMFELKDPTEHISLADWADLLVIAPATANMIGKLAHGIADDLLSTCALAHTGPKLLVPAMNVHMWENPLVNDNLRTLERYGWRVMPPETGRLACGYEGEGKMPAPAEVMWWIRSMLLSPRDLVDQRILISAGACRESIDPVRFLSNRSSGKMGLALARAAAIRGARVTLVHAAMDEPAPHYLRSIPVETAADMRDAMLSRYEYADAVFMAAAVTDYAPKASTKKLPKSAALKLELAATPDILAELGAQKNGQVLVGFAMETDTVIIKGREKMQRKNCDYLAANHAGVAGKSDTTVEFISPDRVDTLSGSKFEVAHKMLDRALGIDQ
jgi:phosphopantothenoylcysteine decarboxylase / phosphopantothenate---cysteine ligase